MQELIKIWLNVRYSLFYVDWTIFLFVFLGLITVGLAVITANLDGVLQLGNTAMGVLAGPLLAIFLLGFFTTAANKYVRFYIFLRIKYANIFFLKVDSAK